MVPATVFERDPPAIRFWGGVVDSFHQLWCSYYSSPYNIGLHAVVTIIL